MVQVRGPGGQGALTVPRWAISLFLLVYVSMDLIAVAHAAQSLRQVHVLQTKGIVLGATVLDVSKSYRGVWSVRYTYRVRLKDGQPHDETRTVIVGADLGSRLRPGQVARCLVSGDSFQDSDLEGNAKTATDAYLQLGVAFFQLAIAGLVYREVRRRRRGKGRGTEARPS